MRTSSLVTISLPPAMVAASEKTAQNQNMTRSELLRTALRRYLEETARPKFSKQDLIKMAREDNRLWQTIETDFRRIRSGLMRERYPYLYE